MRRVKLLLIAAVCVVGVVFAGTRIVQAFSGKEDRPQITCDSETVDVSVLQDESVLLSGVTAWDAQDGDLTGRIMVGGISKLITDNTARITYLVFDSDGNMASVQRTVRYWDYHKPRIDVIRPLVFARSDAMEIISHLQAKDVLDGDISEQIRISTLRTTEETNLYSAVVQVTNSMGDTAKIELPIVVAESDPERPMVYLREYLTHVEQGGTFSTDGNVRSVYVNRIFTSTEGVYVEGEVDTSVPGVYWVRYYFTQNGKTGMTVQTVVVEPAEVDDHE